MILFGTKTSYTEVPGGRRETLSCECCLRRTQFVEVRKNRAATLYFQAIANVGSTRMMRCSHCGGGYPVQKQDDFVGSQDGTLTGWIASTATTAAEALSEAVPEDLSLESASSLLERGKKWVERAEPTVSPWDGQRSAFQARLSDAELRSYVWTQRRAEHPGTVRPLEDIEVPTLEDRLCLGKILSKLG